MGISQCSPADRWQHKRTGHAGLGSGYGGRRIGCVLRDLQADGAKIIAIWISFGVFSLLSGFETLILCLSGREGRVRLPPHRFSCDRSKQQAIDIPDLSFKADLVTTTAFRG